MLQFTLKLIGISPLLHSCDILADPLREESIAHKALSDIKKKTDATHYAIAKSQWQGCLYWNDDLGVVLPTNNIRAAIIGGAKLIKKGMNIKRGVTILEQNAILTYGKDPANYGKKLTIEQLWDQRYFDRRSVINGLRRVMTTRPKFTLWSAEAEVIFDEGVINADEIMKSAENAGKYVGIGGYRPEKGGTFGRFTVEMIGEVRELNDG
ncbi:hypothetical protein [Methylobacter sp.]